MKLLFKGAFVLFLLTLSVASNAMDGGSDFGNVKIFHNLIPTSTLSPKMAKLFGIQRAPNLSYANISVRTKDDTLIGKPVAATIKATAVNEIGQVRFIEFKEVKEPDAIYYIAVIKHGDDETIRINADVIVHNDYKKHQIRFQRRLFHQQ